jgi:putative hemolysin
MKYIDIEASIRESNSGFLKKLPRFIIRLIEKIMKQDEMNVILEKYKDCHGVEFHRSVIRELNLTFEVEGLENLPETSKCFFAANHPYGILDGLLLTKTVLEKYGDLRAIGNESFVYIPNLRPYIALVNPYGMSPKTYVLELEKIYQSDIAITHFPAGEVSRRYDGRIQDCDWQKSFISRAISCQRQIVPFYFHGRNSLLFYSINLIRRAFGIKTNIELVLLPREFFLKRNSTIRFKIGKPISWKAFDRSKTHKEWAQILKNHVYGMAAPNGSQHQFPHKPKPEHPKTA